MTLGIIERLPVIERRERPTSESPATATSPSPVAAKRRACKDAASQTLRCRHRVKKKE
ncbi:hypothetical protein SESBI_31768 [Sesbania bispinosa]|nr:hypothetical protein SESBI_31768 [Sesbania bispinosa]